jgi:hypothetical protein
LAEFIPLPIILEIGHREAEFAADSSLEGGGFEPSVPREARGVLCLPSRRSADNPANYPPICFGDDALWFARKTYQHMATEPALPDAVVALGVRATARW